MEYCFMENASFIAEAAEKIPWIFPTLRRNPPQKAAYAAFFIAGAGTPRPAWRADRPAG